MESVLTQRFLEEIEGQDLYPLLVNARPLAQVDGWNGERYFGRYYADRTLFPALFISQDGKGTLVLPFGKIQSLAREMFVRYWAAPEETHRGITDHGVVRILSNLS